MLRQVVRKLFELDELSKSWTDGALNLDNLPSIDNYGLQRVRNQEFFREWQENLPEVTDSEKQLLDRIQNIKTYTTT
jgi:hypothetical protein